MVGDRRASRAGPTPATLRSMADDFDPTIDAVRRPPAARIPAVRPAAALRPSAAARDEAAKAYRQVEKPPGPARPTDASQVLVRQIMTSPVHTLPLGATAGEAAGLMESRRIRHVPIVGPDGRLAGLVAESDLFRIARRESGWPTRPLEAVMVADVLTLAPDDTLHAAAGRLSQRGLAGGPVTDPVGRPVGFLSARDLLAVLVQRAPLTLWV